ncbi:MAG: diphthine--ammonia ligase [bacterium]|nr:diphthine--ammonia ligase [bacterium]
MHSALGAAAKTAPSHCIEPKRKNITVTHCLNMITEDGKRSRSHGIVAQLPALQAQAMNMGIIQAPCTWDSYETKFKEAVDQLKKENIGTGIFGDIDLEPHREWVERVCGEKSIHPILPLWLGKREDLLEEFISAGFKAIITAVNKDYMGSKWLGRLIDRDFVKDIEAEKNIDPCGENGEYHTLVTDGPIFQKRITVRESKPVQVDKHWFLNITDYGLDEK